jgi:microsomal prostaglandin-E synthase 2
VRRCGVKSAQLHLPLLALPRRIAHLSAAVAVHRFPATRARYSLAMLRMLRALSHSPAAASPRTRLHAVSLTAASAASAAALLGARSHASGAGAGSGAAAAPSTPALPPPGVRQVLLYQYEACPFCNKARAYLDASRTPYAVVEVEPLWKAELRWSPYRKVPLAVLDGAPVGGSSAIVDALEAAAAPAARLGDGSAAERRWRLWVDDRLVGLLTANIYATPRQAWDTMAYLTARNFSPATALPAQAAGAAILWVVARRRAAAAGWTDPRAALRAEEGRKRKRSWQDARARSQARAIRAQTPPATAPRHPPRAGGGRVRRRLLVNVHGRHAAAARTARRAATRSVPSSETSAARAST